MASGRDWARFSPESSKQIKDGSEYFSEFVISAKKEVGKRAASIPINKKVKNPGSRIIKRVKPKTKGEFWLGENIKVD